MKLLVLSLLVAAATASPLLGSERCTWGPSYWCSHIKAAKECNAVKHCISTVWKNQKPPAVSPKDDDNCVSCKVIFLYIDSVLEDNTTQDSKSGELCSFCLDAMKQVQEKVKDDKQEILSDLEQGCSIIPDAGLAAQCKSTVDEFFPEIMQLIIAKLDPKTICTAIGLCTAGVKTTTEPKVQKQRPLDNILGHVQLIRTQSKEVSHSLTFVPKDKASKKPLKTGDSQECNICKLIMTAARQEVKDNKTEMEIEQFIQKYLCSYLGSKKDECNGLITKYGPIVFQFLAQEMDPETLCRALGICTSAKKPLMSMLKENNGVLTMNQVPMQMMTPAIKKPSLHINPQCTICEFIMNELQKQLKDNATEKEITDTLNKICDYLPSTVAKECHDTINQYGPVIISLLVNEVTPVKVCTFLGLCKPSKRAPNFDFGGEGCVLCETMAMYLQALLKENITEVFIRQELERVCNFLPDSISSVCDGIVVMYGEKLVLALANKINAKDLCQYIDLCPKTKTYQAPKITKTLKANVKSNELCPICELIITKLDEYLKENTTEAEVVGLLDKVCGFLPSTVKTDCEDFVKQYGPIVVKLLAGEIDPKQVCTLIKACSGAQKVSIKKIEAAVSCEVCKLAMGYLDAYLKKNSTEAEIEADLEKLCALLPSSVKTECDALVTQYSGLIVKLLAQELAPDVICKILGLCSSQKVSLKKVEGSVTCAVCEYAMRYLEASLTKNATEAEVKEALEKVCGLLPSSVAKECDDLVTKYSSLIVKLIVEELASPEEICKQLGLCSSQKVAKEDKPQNKPRLLGAEKCTYGPSYWCANFDNAKKCNAVEHCNKHVWKNDV